MLKIVNYCTMVLFILTFTNATSNLEQGDSSACYIMQDRCV